MALIRQVYRAILFLLFLLQCFFTAAVLSVLDKITGNYHDRSGWAKRYLGWFCHLAGLRIHVTGTPSKEPCLIISNHISWIDIPVLGSLIPVYFLSKAEVRSWPLIGALAEQAGTFFVQRGDGKSALVREEIEARLNKKKNVLVFPEGTTSGGESVLRFHSKLIGAASNAEVAIQPITLYYQNANGGRCVETPFVGNDEFLTHLKKIFAKPYVQVRVHFHPLYQLAKDADINLATAELHQQIEKQLYNTCTLATNARPRYAESTV
jgi:1-acyl-sn-glycerol-3-phosphate acyltransferase